METQKKQLTKGNRLTVPFYSPPTRHYGKTPSEIIREARASVMNLSTAAIKPVLTSRPFTPKEKERTLFGNVKRRLSRPPSAFSLSYLQKPEALQHVKLPAIETISQKKIDRNVGSRNNHSLDNLIEEYETDISEEIIQRDAKGLPFFSESKRHSPLFAVTQNNDNFTRLPEKRTIFTISKGFVGDKIHQTDNPYQHFSTNIRQDEAERGDSRQSKCISQTDSGGIQYEEGTSFNRAETNNSNFATASGESSCDKFYIGSSFNSEKEEKVDEKKICFEMSKNQLSLKEEHRVGVIIKEEENSVVKDNHNQENQKDHENLNPSNNENVLLVEKNIATDTISEYLSMLNNRSQEILDNKCPTPKEILELYETAEFYDLLDSKKKNGRDDSSVKIEHTAKELVNECGPEKKHLTTDYLKVVQENIRSFDLKIKHLNDSIENFEEKLNGKIKILSPNHNIDGNTDCAISSNVKATDSSKEERNLDLILQREGNMNYKEPNIRKNLMGEKKQYQSLGWDGFWKNSYYMQKGEIQNHSTVETQGLETLEQYLSRLKSLFLNGAGNTEIADLLRLFYEIMKKEDIHNKHDIENEKKISILRCIYNFADNEDPKILLNLARIVFSLKVESSLSAACKMVFKVARIDENDHLFLEIEDILELFLDGIGLVSPLDAAECCIYGYGALKFLAMNHIILSKLIALGVLDLLILHMKIINSAKTEGCLVNEQVQHAMFQLTGALRNIAAGDGVLPLFITTNAIPVLCTILNQFRQCEDLVTNISRILSLLSADEDTCDVLMSIENILRIITELMDEYKTNSKILIRLAYCLGNIVAYNDLARLQLSRHEESLIILIKILQIYIDKDLELSVGCNETIKNYEMDIDEVNDIIVKIIRIIANMCMNPVVGSNLSPNESNEKNSLKLSKLLTTLLHRKDPGITLLACLGCLNNISYYCSNHSSLIDVTEAIVRVLGLHDEECKAEAARVLGNLTRNQNIRELIRSTGGVEQLTKLLDSKDQSVFRAACGALVNLMLDSETRKSFVESQGIDRLVSGLENFSKDWNFAGLICQAIWNSCADNLQEVVSNNNVENLLNVLAQSLDEENWDESDPSWDEYAFLATDLLEKITAHLELS